MLETIIRFQTPWFFTARILQADGNDATLTNAQKTVNLQRPECGLGQITFNTRGQSPRCPRYLSWEAGALDSLRAFFNLVLVAAAMGSYHFTRSCPLLLWAWRTQVSRKGPIFGKNQHSTLKRLHVSRGRLSFLFLFLSYSQIVKKMHTLLQLPYVCRATATPSGQKRKQKWLSRNVSGAAVCKIKGLFNPFIQDKHRNGNFSIFIPNWLKNR